MSYLLSVRGLYEIVCVHMESNASEFFFDLEHTIEASIMSLSTLDNGE